MIGHKNPDTDSIASSLAYAELKCLEGYDALPCRLGTLNEETKFATRFFGVEAPDLLTDARCTLKDIRLDEPVFIDEDATCNSAYRKILKTKSKTLFICKNGHFKGIVSMGDLASLRLLGMKRRTELMRHTTLKALTSDLKGKLIVKSAFVTSGKINLVTKTSFFKVEPHIEKTICIVTDNEDVQIQTLNARPAVMIIGYGALPSLNVQKRALELSIPVIVSSMAASEMLRIIYECIPLKKIMTKKVITYNINDYVDDVASAIVNTRFRSYPVVDGKGNVLASLSRFHLFKHPKKNFILVDHSSKSQSIANIDKAEILEIIDHHHIGDIQTNRPIYYRNEKLGSTATIIFGMYKERGILPKRSTAGMMLSAIISDTLYFKSETTTPKDKEVAIELAKIAKVDLDTYAKELLSSSVNLKDGDVKELIVRDLKHYHFGKYDIAVGQTNYQDLEDIQKRLKEFSKVLKDMQESKEYDLMIMMFTQVLAQGTMFVYYGPLSKIMGEVIETQFDDHSGYDRSIMSRKQQLIPAILESLEE